MTGALSALVALLVATVPLASAHVDADHGMLTFHDDEDGASTTTLDCGFWVRGHNMDFQNGTIEAFHDLDGPDAHGHVLGDVNGTMDESGTFSFLAGPFTLHATDDAWRIIARMAENETHQTVLDPFLDYTACPPEEGPADCADTLVATANADGSVTLEWGAHDGATQYIVHRMMAGDEESTELGTTDVTTWTDVTAEAGVTYTYHIVALGEAGFLAECGSAEVTAIPFFGSLPAALLAVGLMAGYVVMRRRRT